MEGEEPTKSGTEPIEPRASTKHKRVRNWLIDFAVTLLIVLPIGKLFEILASPHELEHVLKFQEHLYESVSNLSPSHLLSYIFVPADFLRPRVGAFLASFLPLGLTDWLMMVLQLVMLGLGVGILPWTILAKGTLLEAIVAFGIFVPLTMLFMRSGSEDDKAVGVFLALGMTLVVFWIGQMVMLGALYAFGGVLHTAQTWAGSAFVGSAVYWCAVRSTEHSLTERALHAVFRRA